MPRKYTLRKRADQQADTQRRIVEATVELHGEVGPAATMRSMIADRAGVQRHTLYAHFPDDRSLFMACSGLSLERDPLPEAGDASGITDIRTRVARGLAALYGWYARNESLAACVLRDAEHHAPTREITDLRFGPMFANYRKVLGAGLGARATALLNAGLSFHTWRVLAHESHLSPQAAADVVAEAVAGLSATTRSGVRAARRKA